MRHETVDSGHPKLSELVTDERDTGHGTRLDLHITVTLTQNDLHVISDIVTGRKVETDLTVIVIRLTLLGGFGFKPEETGGTITEGIGKKIGLQLSTEKRFI